MTKEANCEFRKKSQEKYRRTDKGKACQKKYRRADEGKACQKKYHQTDKYKECQKKYRQTDKYKERQKKYRQTDKYKKFQQKRRLAPYGMSAEEYKTILEIQCGVCAICGRISTRNLVVDHNHTTGKVRGLLCHKCNLALGGFEDNILLLEKAIKYLSNN